MKGHPVLAALLGVAAVIGLVALVARSGGRREVDPDLEGGAVGQQESPATVSAVSPRAPAARVEVAPSDATVRDRTRARAETPPPPPPPQHEPLRFRIEGRVVTQAEVPIRGAEVVLRDDTLLAWSDPAGIVASDVEVARDLGSLGGMGTGGSTDLFVFATGFAAAELSTPIRPGESVQLGTVRLGPGGEVTGHVFRADGRPAAGAWVTSLSTRLLPAEDWNLRDGGPPPSWSAGRRPGVAADRAGAFRLRGVPAGESFLLSSSRGSWSTSAPFELEAGGSLARDLALEPGEDPTWTVTGRVVLPDGSPLPQAEVEFFSPAGTRSFDAADDAGRFEVEQVDRVGMRVVARDPDRRWYPAVIEDLEPRDQEIELVLGAPEWLEVVVADEKGDPIPWSHVRCLDAGQGPLEPTGETGRVTLLLPRDSFELEAFAPGFRTETFGPFEAASVDGPLVLSVTPGQAVRGRVAFHGAPVAGARVTVSGTAEPGALFVSQALTSLEHPFLASGTTELGRDDATSDDQGHFVVTLHEDGWHSVRVQREGFPMQVFGPYEWTKDEGVEGLELAIEEGGAIEGRVLTAPGVSPAGRIVGASDRWNVVHSTRADDDGHYRIEDLAPGDWQVRALVPPVASVQDYRLLQIEEARVAWDCVVRAGETTVFDLDLSADGTYVLAGHFAWAGGPAFAGAAQLLEDAKVVATAMLDTDGRFELSLSHGGRFRLDLSQGLVVLHQPVELFPGRNEWEAVLPWGSLRLSGPTADPRERMIACSWQGEGGLTLCGWRILQPTSDSGSVRWERLPAGRVRLLRFGQGSRWNDLDTWTPWKEVEIRPGEETVVESP